MSYYVIIRGPLGAGKTTVAKELAKQLNAEYISVDEILEKNKLDIATEEGIPARNFVKANDLAIPAAREALKKKVVIFDGNFYYRKQLVHLVEALGRDNFVFTLKAPLKTCLERDDRRKDKHGSQAAKEVYKLTDFDYGTPINTENKTAAQVVAEIRGYLPKK